MTKVINLILKKNSNFDPSIRLLILIGNDLVVTIAIQLKNIITGIRAYKIDCQGKFQLSVKYLHVAESIQ